MDTAAVTVALKEGIGHILRQFDELPSYEDKLHYVNSMPETMDVIANIFGQVERCLRSELAKLAAVMQAQAEIRH